MDEFALNKSVVGKNFKYWKNLYDKGIIESHVNYLRLAHLKYAVDQNLITTEEYFAHHIRITEKYKPYCSGYEPCTLMDFCIALKTHNSTCKLEISQSFHIDQCSENKISELQKNVPNTFENMNQQNKSIVSLNKYHPDKEKKSQTKTPKKFRKKRKKKKKWNNNICSNTIDDYPNNMKIKVIEDASDELQEQISTKQIVTPKDSVKIFVCRLDEKNKSKSVSKESLVSTKKSVRDVFSKILKQFKEERHLKSSMINNCLKKSS